MNVFTFNQFNASLLNKSIGFLVKPTQNFFQSLWSVGHETRRHCWNSVSDLII